MMQNTISTTDNSDDSDEDTTNDLCDRYWSAENYTNYAFLSAYEGLPECLIVGVVGFLILFLTFCAVRKWFWNHGSLALINRMEHRNLTGTQSEYNVWSTIYLGGQRASFDPNNSEQRLTVDTLTAQQDHGMFTWIPAFYRITDEEIFMKCGQDALQFLIFHKYLIVYSLITSVICLTVVLPLNLTQGYLEDSHHTFGQSTIININPNSPILWIHTSLGMLLLCLAIGFMHHFTTHVHYHEYTKKSRTLMISKIPKDNCVIELLEEHFQEAYPDCIVEEVQLAYNVGHLMELVPLRDAALVELKHAEKEAFDSGERPQIMPYHCSQICCCKCCKACGWKEVDAIDYYTEQLAKYDELCEAEKITSLHDMLGIAFVSFEDEYMAKRVKNDFRFTCGGKPKATMSSLSQRLEIPKWKVDFAPAPDDIYWYNLSTGAVVWWAKTIVANIFLLALVFFLTTPSVVLNELNRIEIFADLTGTDSNMVLQFIPTLLLLSASAVLPLVVSSVDLLFIGHYTKTALNHSIMIKVYLYLLIMVIVMPSLGFSSIGAVIEWFASSARNSKFRWNCIFLSSNTAFYVNYLIGSATIIVGVDLLRIPQLMKCLLRMAYARTKAERLMVQKTQLIEFEYGLWYAWVLCHFTVMMVYSIPCPLITVPGLLYQVMKYYCDRYNLYYAYSPSKIDKGIHETAVNFVIIALFCLMLTLLCFIIMRADEVNGMGIFAIVVLVVTFLLFCIRMFWSRLRPPKSLTTQTYEKIAESHDVDLSGRPSEKRVSYLPPILESELRASEDDYVGRRSSSGYGAFKRGDANSFSEIPDWDEAQEERPSNMNNNEQGDLTKASKKATQVAKNGRIRQERHGSLKTPPVNAKRYSSIKDSKNSKRDAHHITAQRGQ